MILLLSGCEEIMDIQFQGDSEKTLVVEGMITTDTTAHQVMLSWTGDFFKKLPQDMISRATVAITDGISTFDLTEMEDHPGIYVTRPDVYGEVGKSYTLHISLPDGRTFSGTEELSYCADIDSIAQTDNYNHGFFGFDYFGYDLLFYAQEPDPIGDYYLYYLYLNDSLCTDSISEVVFASDEFVNGNYINGLTTHLIAEDEFIGDSMKVTLEMQSVSETYYEYMTGLMLETLWRGSPWDGPPANVPSNMTNGARGYFRASDVKRISRYFYATSRRGSK
ncbi:MAG: DUF4249 domain-containing protein [Bacteroidales bacterium]|nr:DUF4249 domain-containing protein [Bacteroidales bacterium]